MTQLLLHLWGDYILQSDWMAKNKTKAWFPATIHALLYSLTFLLLRPSLAAWIVIFGTHLLIDRFRLARYMVWAKNWMAPSVKWFCPNGQWTNADTGEVWSAYKQPTLPFELCSKTGYTPNCPDWLAFWLLIIADNTLHITINFMALKWL